MTEIKYQQQDFNDLPLIDLIVEQITSDFAGADLLNGKLGYQTTSNQLQTVIAGAIAKILTSQDLATGTDLVSAAAGKIIVADLIASSGDTPANLDQAIPTLQKVIDEISSRISGAFIFQGGLVGNANLTGNSTGNAYLDGTSSVKTGDTLRITSDGSLTVSNGTIAVKTGDTITFINNKADSSILVADVFITDNDAIKSIDISFDNSGSNLISTNVEAAIKEVNAKNNDSAISTGQVFTAGQNKTLTHNLNSTSVAVFYRVNGSSDGFQPLASTNATANTIDVQIDKTGTYDFIFKKLITA
jgi:hypothetical protein